MLLLTYALKTFCVIWVQRHTHMAGSTQSLRLADKKPQVCISRLQVVNHIQKLASVHQFAIGNLVAVDTIAALSLTALNCSDGYLALRPSTSRFDLSVQTVTIKHNNFRAIMH